MGDVRFRAAYERVRSEGDPAVQIRLLPEETLVEALAGASRADDPYLANVLATELLNRRRAPAGPVEDGDRLERAVRDVGPAEHLCLVYETRQEQFAAAIPYIAQGLENGDRCLYIVDENTGAEVALELERTGVDVKGRQASGQLSILSKQEAYLKRDAFDPDWMVAFLAESVERAHEEGYPGVRITGEMTWALGGEPGTDRIVEYEAKLNRFFPGSRASAVCQYNRRRFSAAVIRDVLHTHPIVVYGGLVCSNSYYVPPEEFLGGRRVELEVDRLLENIRAREHAEQRLRDMNRTLEAAVDERTRELQMAYRELEAFSYSVSHDLRAPLRGIDAYLHALDADHAAELGAEARALVGRARAESARLTDLVNGLLALSRVGRGEIARDDVDVAAVALDVAAVLAAEDPTRAVRVVVEGPIPVRADPQLARVVLDNLLRNAWKFTRGVPEPEVRVGSGALDGRPAFFVKDNGVGFDPAQAHRLFVPFQRIHGDRYEGTGIGLATVRRVVQRHGGQVRAEGAPGGGATFWVAF